MLARQLGNMLISSRQATAAIDHDDRDIRFFECPHGLLNHEFMDTLFAARDTACINDEIRNGTQFAETVLPIARQPRVISNQGIARTRQAIE